MIILYCLALGFGSVATALIYGDWATALVVAGFYTIVVLPLACAVLDD